MPKKKGGGSRKAAETPEEKAMRLEMERIKAIEDEIHRAGDVGSVLVFVTLPRRHRVKIK
jgi:hypothetical protein